MVARRTWRRRFALLGMLCVAAGITLELISFALFALLDGEAFTYGRLERERATIENAVSGRLTSSW